MLARSGAMVPWKALPLGVLVASVAHAAPARYPLPKVPSLKAMTKAATANQEPVAPRCFAYSAKQHLFACLGHAAIYNMDHVGADDQATNIRIDAIGPERESSWTIAAIGGRSVTPRSIVEMELATLGVRPLATKPIKIIANQWTEVGPEQLFLRISPHEGDASFENFGDLTLRCKTGVNIAIDLRALDIELGETSWAFRSPDGNWLALGIVGVDGGEDTAEYTLDTAVIDVATSCAQHTPALWTSAASR